MASVGAVIVESSFAQIEFGDGLAAARVALGRGGGDHLLATWPSGCAAVFGGEPAVDDGGGDRAGCRAPARSRRARSMRSPAAAARRCTAARSGSPARDCGRRPASRSCRPATARPGGPVRGRVGPAARRGRRPDRRSSTARPGPVRRRGRGCRSAPRVKRRSRSATCASHIRCVEPSELDSTTAGPAPVTTACTSTAVIGRPRRPRPAPDRRRCTSSRGRSGRRGGAPRRRRWPERVLRSPRSGARVRCRIRWD